MSAASLKSKKTAASTVGGNESTMAGEGAKAAGGQKNNDWIPTQAVRAILQIKEQFNG